MSDWLHVGPLSELPPGSRTSAWVRGTKVMVANVDGTLYAVDEQCTHMQCSLLEGPLKGVVVGCPCHLAAFDLRDGRALFGPTVVPLPTYRLEVRDGEIWIEQPPPDVV